MPKGPSYTIHPFSVASYPALMAVGGLEPVPAIAGRRRGTPLDKRPGLSHGRNKKAFALTDNLESPYHQTCMSLSCGRKPTYPVKTHAEAGRTCTRRPILKSNLGLHFDISLPCKPPLKHRYQFKRNMFAWWQRSSGQWLWSGSKSDFTPHLSTDLKRNLRTNNPNWYKHSLLGKVITKPPECITLRVSSCHLYSSSKPCWCLLSCFLCVWKSGCGWFAGWRLAHRRAAEVGPGGNIYLHSEQFQTKLHSSDKTEADTPSSLCN